MRMQGNFDTALALELLIQEFYERKTIYKQNEK